MTGGPYKLLTVDLDGTLIRRDGTVHPDDRRAIEQLREADVPVAIVTGRLYSGSAAAAREVGIQGPIACVDGSQIVDTRGDRPLSHTSISGDNAGALRKVLARRPCAHFVFTGEGIMHDMDGQPYAPYVRTWSERVRVVSNVVDHTCWTHEEGVLAVVVVGEPEHIDTSAEEIAREVDARVMSFSVRRYEATSAMVIRANGPDKGTAVEWLAAHYDCTPEEVVAVGDWLNDIPMFKRAGRSFAMAQGPEEVKQHATDRLEARMDDDGAGGGGVAEAIRRAFDIG